MNGNNGADPGVETGPRYAPGIGGQTYVEDRTRRRRRSRLVGYLVFIPLWVVSLVPLARESLDGRESADAVLVYLAVAAISLGVAAVIRGVYVLLTKRRFGSPWLVIIAAAVAVVGYAIQGAGEEVVPLASAQAVESRVE